MTEQPPSERRAAHERLSTGALARWTRACATHPWRVVLGWLGIVVLLIVLVGTVGGSLKDEFEIPGSDTQRATDLIESEFASEQGGVLNLVFAAPEGERLDTPERKAAIEAAIAKLKTSEFKPTEDKAGIESVGDPFERGHVLGRRAHRLRGSAVRPGHLRRRTAIRSSPCRTPSARRSSRPASRSSTTATPSSRPSSRARRSCSACSRRSSCCSSCSARSWRRRSRSCSRCQRWRPRSSCCSSSPG